MIGVPGFISNVPLSASGVLAPGLMALAAGSTIAGNLTILGAASNVIVIQGAEKRGCHEITLANFIVIGLPLTAVNALVYWVYFVVVG